MSIDKLMYIKISIVLAFKTHCIHIKLLKTYTIMQDSLSKCVIFCTHKIRGVYHDKK